MSDSGKKSDKIIRQQADYIEELQSELVEVYDQLYAKEKRGRKCKRDEQERAEPRRAPDDEAINLTWFSMLQLYLIDRDQLRQAITWTTSTHVRVVLWQVTATLTYFPFVIATLGFMLGSTPQPVSGLYRIVFGAVYCAVLYIAWLATAEMGTQPRKGRQILAGLIAGTIFALGVTLPVLAAAEPESPNWGLIALAGVITANAGIAHGILRTVHQRLRTDLNFEFVAGAWGAVIPLVVAAVGSLPYFTHTTDTNVRVSDFMLIFAIAGPLMAPALLVAFVFDSIFFSMPVLGGFALKMPRSEMLFRLAYQTIAVCLWFLIAVALIIFGVFGHLIVYGY